MFNIAIFTRCLKIDQFCAILNFTAIFKRVTNFWTNAQEVVQVIQSVSSYTGGHDRSIYGKSNFVAL